MPVADSRSTLSRQWELLKLLPNRLPGETAQQLTARLADAGYQISKRTVERDLNDLSLVFPLRCNDKGKPHGWYWAPDAPTDLPGISLSEALTLQLLENGLRPLLPGSILKSLEPRFAQARRKLGALTEQLPAARWIDKIASVAPELNLIAPEIDAKALDIIQQALLHDRQVTATYYAAHSHKTRDLRLNPLALILRGRITYLAATAEPYSDVRLYAMHRFKQAEMQEAPVKRPDDFELEAYIQRGALLFGGGESIRLKAQINAELATQLRETPMSPDMQLAPLGEGYALEATVLDSWQLRWWILSQAEAMEVLEPQSLRAEIDHKLRQASELYQ